MSTCAIADTSLDSHETHGTVQARSSREFVDPSTSGVAAVEYLQSPESLLERRETSTRPEEIAEIDLALGRIYGYRKGLVDPAKAARHYSQALSFEFPITTYLQIVMGRGNAYEQLGELDRALQDYLRGLVAISEYDLSGPRPELLRPAVPFDIRSDHPDDAERRRDYQRYRQAVERQQFLRMQKFHFVEAVKRLRTSLEGSPQHTRAALEAITPDPVRQQAVWRLLDPSKPSP
jgi:tetratricopeptide (TPR) repeat protein